VDFGCRMSRSDIERGFGSNEMLDIIQRKFIIEVVVVRLKLRSGDVGVKETSNKLSFGLGP
jgi:hypothetical protein